MNTFQQSLQYNPAQQEKDEPATEDESVIVNNESSLIDKFKDSMPLIAAKVDRNYEIAVRTGKGTFTSDKILRLISACVKVVRSFNLTNNLTSFQKLSLEIGQLRRLLRCDRTLMILKELATFHKKVKVSKVDRCLMMFKIMILFGDLNDILAYLIQLNVVERRESLAKLRTNVANIYFLECLGWFIYHLYEYMRSKDEETKHRNKMMIIKYTMDALVSHNDFSRKMFTVNPKIISLIGLTSSYFNLYLIWK